MTRRDRTRLWIVLAVVIIALLYSWPIAGKINLGLDLKGGAHIVLQAKGTPENPVEDDAIDRLLVVLRSRVDQYGVAEPIIQRSGRDRVIIDLPGVQDPAAALELIGKTAVLEFREVLDHSSMPSIPMPERRNYDDDEGYERAHERRNAALEAWDGVERRFAERAAGIDGTIVSRGDDDEPSFYLLGGVLVAGGELTDAVRTSDS
ncbi:MAG: protein translocase subunit SecD, partial [Synergistaceae bacterium]|nr:protein translocase subunit SecD [Synergistaceae bacterium]